MRVVELMRSTFGVPPSTKIFNILIKQLAKTDCTYPQAFQVFEELSRNKYPGARPDLITYTTLMRASIDGNQPDEAIHLYKRCTRAGLQPNAAIYSLAVSAYSAQGDTKSALALLDKMEAHNEPADEMLYCNYAKTLLAQHRIAELVAVGARMDRLGVRLSENVAAVIKRYIDSLAARSSIAMDVIPLVELVRMLHKHNMNYRMTNIFEPFLGMCPYDSDQGRLYADSLMNDHAERYRQQRRPLDAVLLMEHLHSAGEKVHRSFYYPFVGMCASEGDTDTHRRLTQLRDMHFFRR